MSISKYKETQNSTENPRQTEYRLFADVTKALISIKDLNSKYKGPEFFKTLDWNRRLWLALQTDLAHEENKFPEELKANLISISLWVDKQTRSVMKGEAQIDTLISINRTIMEGLLASSNENKTSEKLNKNKSDKLI
ncbi:MAG: hypothetical protein CFH01_01769 [Alphaproteobacteria bacterium MarineAlpha2_Bin1]|nr:MAG: hypothetical protein CFH01_01769 [Alphaproteobacteria bacterium MarineAlpha2_Bin1]|tara:strand:+ start:934 stop:1344 length:411 start_codon:yes stop_codon:yes gene_type:complete